MNKLSHLLIKPKEFNFRRNLLGKVISKQNPKVNILLLRSSNVQYKTLHIPRKYHQDTYFNYLTGFTSPNSILLMTIQNDNVDSYLFIDEPSESEKLWNGSYPSKLEAIETSGINNIDKLSTFKSFYDSLKFNSEDTNIWNLSKNIYEELNIESKYKAEDVGNLIDVLRLYKSESEIEIMKEAGRIINESLISVMKYSVNKDVNEHEISGKLYFEITKRGSDYAYPPVIAGGNNANTIHYLHGNEPIRSSELILIDAGCDVLNYYSDVTRTWPVHGKFNKHQAILYDILYSVFIDCIKYTNTNISLNHLMFHMNERLRFYLNEAGVIKTRLFKRSSIPNVCPHHVSHYLGMDIHDSPSISCNYKLSPGMVFTIEPGIYLPKNSDFVDKEFQGIGMRLEDDFYIDFNGNIKCLNEGLARSREEIEHILLSTDIKSSKTNVLC